MLRKMLLVQGRMVKLPTIRWAATSKRKARCTPTSTIAVTTLRYCPLALNFIENTAPKIRMQQNKPNPGRSPNRRPCACGTKCRVEDGASFCGPGGSLCCSCLFVRACCLNTRGTGGARGDGLGIAGGGPQAGITGRGHRRGLRAGVAQGLRAGRRRVLFFIFLQVFPRKKRAAVYGKRHIPPLGAQSRKFAPWVEFHFNFL